MLSDYNQDEGSYIATAFALFYNMWWRRRRFCGLLSDRSDFFSLLTLLSAIERLSSLLFANALLSLAIWRSARGFGNYASPYVCINVFYSVSYCVVWLEYYCCGCCVSTDGGADGTCSVPTMQRHSQLTRQSQRPPRSSCCQSESQSPHCFSIALLPLHCL